MPKIGLFKDEGGPWNRLPEEPESQTRLMDWAGQKPAKRKSSTIGDAAWAKACEQAKAMMASADWREATARHFAATYELLHERVYGVLPAELTPHGRSLCAAMAAQLLERQFGGDEAQMASYLRWAWAREHEREKWRRENGRGGGRITPRLMFGGSLVTDYRVAEARRKT